MIARLGYADRRLSHYEFDHVISLERGGSPTDPRNLVPQPHQVVGGWGSYAKDRLEDRLHQLVCAHRLPLADAQRLISTNWVAAYRKFIGPVPNNARLHEPAGDGAELARMMPEDEFSAAENPIR